MYKTRDINLASYLYTLYPSDYVGLEKMGEGSFSFVFGVDCSGVEMRYFSSNVVPIDGVKLNAIFGAKKLLQSLIMREKNV